MCMSMHVCGTHVGIHDTHVHVCACVAYVYMMYIFVCAYMCVHMYIVFVHMGALLGVYGGTHVHMCLCV